MAPVNFPCGLFRNCLPMVWVLKLVALAPSGYAVGCVEALGLFDPSHAPALIWHCEHTAVEKVFLGAKAKKLSAVE